MPWSKTLLRNAKLYLILDTDVCGYDELFEILKQSVAPGIDIVQLRDKKGFTQKTIQFALRVKKFLAGRIPLIINDRVDIALVLGAEGVHLGQGDMPLADARRLLGKSRIVGASCQTWAHVLKATREGADYIGFGSVFKTLTKPERRPMELSLLKKVCEQAQVPIFAIGGITTKSIPILISLGVKRVAVCRDICLAKDVKAIVKEFKVLLNNFVKDV